ncbi:MAG: DUF3592 domain-containing protein [Desulfobacteraceae bacterium]
MAIKEAAQENKKKDAIIIIIALLGFALVFCGFGFYKYNIGKKNASWPTVKGKMIHSRPVPTKVNKSTEYRLAVKYRYSVDGKTYTGDCITSSDGFQKTRKEAYKILKKYPVGGEVTVYYSPSDPGYSVLKTGANKNAFISLFAGAVCFLLAVAVIVSALKKK